MDYDWGSAASAQYPYMNGFPSNDGIINTSRNNSIIQAQSIEGSLDDGTTFIDENYNYAYDPSVLGADAGALNALTSLAQTSPHSHYPYGLGHNDMNGSVDMDGEMTRRGSSEEKESMTPAKSRRKAQNRAAQRAFRERKERHVRDLEAKLNLLTTTTSSLQSDNERLKLMLQRAQTENELLRAKASSAPSLSPSHQSEETDDGTIPSHNIDVFPDSHSQPLFDPLRLSQGLLSTDPRSVANQRGSLAHGESRLLSASATWDLLQSHPLYLAGAVDIGEICDRLKKLARCDGMGPMFQEDQVRQIIEEVGRNGHDELI